MINKIIDKFDWNSNSIAYVDSQYGLERLIMALVIPTIDYFVPILAKIDFPEYLIEHPDIWKSIFEEFAPQYKQAVNNLHEWSENDFYPAYYQALKIHKETNPTVSETNKFADRFYEKHFFSNFYTYLKMWKMFLEMLKDRTNKSVATEVERWMYRHYLSKRYYRGTHEWWHAIVEYQEYPDSSAPEFFLPLASEIYQQINYSEYHAFEEEWRLLYFEKYNAEYEQGGIHSAYLADCDIFIHAFVSIRISKVLRTLAQSLKEEQIMLITDWAAKVTCRSCPELLSFDWDGRGLILADIPFAKFPSILNVENLKDSITFSKTENTHVLLLK
jgi:hypothetical protein